MSHTLVLVTGASGFIGSYMCALLLSQGVSVRAVTTNSDREEKLKDVVYQRLLEDFDMHIDGISVEFSVVVIDRSLNEFEKWVKHCEGVWSIIHLAGRAHILDEVESNPRHAFQSTNGEMTASLAQAAKLAGVSRFVFVSSIGVHGDTSLGESISESSELKPHDEYSKSKLDAEVQVQEIFKNGSTEYVIIRPPLVYGPRVRGNMLSLLRLSNLGFPLPLGSIRNKRSIISLKNLCWILSLCCVHPKAANQIYVVADEKPVSVDFIFNRVGSGMGKRYVTFPFPVFLLMLFAKLCGVKNRLVKISSELIVDSSLIRDALNWADKEATEDALFRMGQWYSNHVS